METKQIKKPRFFGCPEIFGDGVSWSYIGDTPEQIKKCFEMAFDAATLGDVNWEEQDDEHIIKVVMMTDKEVKELPDL